MIASVTPKRINDYVKQYNQFDNSALESLISSVSSRKDILPCVQQDTARMLQFIIGQLKPTRILELGTGVGVSTLVMAFALADNGRITTIERGARFVTEAARNFEQYGYSDRIELINGDVLAVVPQLVEDEVFDLIFLDAGKQTYGPLLESLVVLLRPNGVLLADDTLFPAMDLPERNKRGQKVIHKFNDLVKSHPDLSSLILPIGHGLTIATKNSK